MNKIDEKVRAAALNFSVIDRLTYQVGDWVVRRWTIGSMLILQRWGNVYGSLGEFGAPDDRSWEDALFEKAGITEYKDKWMQRAELIYLHCCPSEELCDGDWLLEDRTNLIENFMSHVLPEDVELLLTAIFGDAEMVQAAMVYPEAKSDGDEDPLGHGRHGQLV